jgi:hypothetical protein
MAKTDPTGFRAFADSVAKGTWRPEPTLEEFNVIVMATENALNKAHEKTARLRRESKSDEVRAALTEVLNITGPMIDRLELDWYSKYGDYLEID